MTQLASIHGSLQTLWTVVICILLVAAEFFVLALIAAPRWVARKLLALLRAPARLARRLQGQPGSPGDTGGQRRGVKSHVSQRGGA